MTLSQLQMKESVEGRPPASNTAPGSLVHTSSKTCNKY